MHHHQYRAENSGWLDGHEPFDVMLISSLGSRRGGLHDRRLKWVDIIRRLAYQRKSRPDLTPVRHPDMLRA